ncbi:glutathione binding-like protein [Methylophaga thiooxydans]|uniref:glutathione binding-like protein n=1 Tax=Methylophaga thiooxydans TaxID=392484 RepID=UPI002353F3C3|nr:glutathione binding-like protein [Methylophaga thiooxydans]
MDIFDQKAPMDLDGNYGSTGEMKKAQYMLQLLGTPWDADTLKCIITAAEQGMEMRTGYLDTLNAEQNSPEYQDIFEFGTYPGLKEADYNVAGANAIMAFINARGLGYSLVPKNVTEAATQDFWVDIAVTEATPNVDTLVQEQLLKPMTDSGYTANTEACEKAKANLNRVLELLEKQLTGNAYIVNKYSFADVHWTAVIHLLMQTEEASLVRQRPQISRWYDALATRKSNCGQDIVSFSLLPNKDDIKQQELSSVVIDDY